MIKFLISRVQMMRQRAGGSRP